MKADQESNNKRKPGGTLGKFVETALCLFLVALLVLNPFGGMASLGNQEFFSYHMRDLFGLIDVNAAEGSDYYLSTGTYETTAYGKLFGAAKGRNVIVIQVESLQNIMINAEYEGQVITPNLNKLIEQKDTMYFKRYYQQLGGGNTSDSEFVTNNSLIGSVASYTYDLYQNNYFKGLPWILKERGYSTAVFHANDKTFWNREGVYPQMGFDTFVNSDYFDNDHIIGSGKIQGASDKSMFKQSIKKLKELEEPFYGFFVTLSSHHPYVLPEDLQGIKLKEEHKGTTFGKYLNAIHYADEALGEFLKELKAEGLYDDSIIAIYGDHSGLPLADKEINEDVSDFLGTEYTFIDQMNIPLIFCVPGSSKCDGEYDIVGGEVDFLPTISYLLGIKELDTLYLGQNLLTAKEGLVAEQTYLLKGSFFSDDYMVEYSRDGVFSHSKALDMHTKEEIDLTDEMEEKSAKAMKIIELSQFYLENDVLSLAIKDGMTIEEILNGTDKSGERPVIIADPGAPEVSKRRTQPTKMTDLYDKGYKYIVAYAAKEPKDRYSLSPKELLTWMDEHRKANIVLITDDDDVLDVLSEINSLVETEFSDYLTSSMGANSSNQHLTNVGDKIIPVLSTMKNYTKTQYAGYSKILFSPSLSEYNDKEYADFFKMNNPWAAAVSESDAESAETIMTDYEGFLYIWTDGGLDAVDESMSEKRVSGVISTSVPDEAPSDDKNTADADEAA